LTGIKNLKMEKKFSMVNAIASVVILVLFMILPASCKKEKSSPITPAPVIHLFSPANAAKDSLVVIAGDHFSTNAAENLVTFNGVAASVVTTTATSITVKVPLHAKDGKLTVKVGNQIVTSSDDFRYIYTATTFAGSGIYGFRDGDNADARFASAFGIGMDSAGNIIVADGGNNRVRKITPAGIVSTIAGDGSIGNRNGAAGQAQFNYPRGVAIDAAGNIFVADAGNNLIRKITPAGVVSTFAGDGTNGFADGESDKAKFSFPVELTIDAAGIVYVTDGSNGSVRKITPAGVVSTLGAGSFGFPEGITIDKAGNLFIADAADHKIFKMTPAGVLTFVAGTGIIGLKDGPGTEATFTNPEGIAVDAAGNLYVGDLSNAAVRKITPNGIVSTIAGGARGFAEGIGPVAKFLEPSGITADKAGNVFVTDVGNARIRKLQ
jgi:sugar lactone lactonase YvrE